MSIHLEHINAVAHIILMENKTHLLDFEAVQTDSSIVQRYGNEAATNFATPE